MEFFAKVWTGAGAPRRVRVVWEGARILEVRDVNDQTPPPPRKQGETNMMVLPEGALVVPGLHDAHLHLLEGGLRLDQLDLYGVVTREEFEERLREYVKRREWRAGDWVEANRLNEALLNITRKEIDRVCADRPVFIWSHDWHSAFVNSKALVIAGVDSRMEDPEGGRFERDSSGVLNGVLRETAAYRVRKFVPEPTAEREQSALEQAQQLAFSHGFTAVSCSVRSDYLRGYETFARSGKQKIRLNIWPVTTQFDLERDRFERVSNSVFRKACFKGFSDGALGSRTAAMWQPYEGDPDYAGLPLVREGPLARFIRGAHKEGYQVAVHAIGDRANSICLDAFEMAGSAGVGPMLRPRIEHAQFVREQDIPRFAELGVIASMQPIHCTADMHMVEPRIGSARAKGAYAWRSLLDHGATLAFGSDWPVEEMSALAGIHAAVTRENKTTRGVFGEPERIGVAEALTAYTRGAAYAAGWDGEMGTIEAGKAADFTVLSRDIFACKPEEILDAEVLMTVVNGAVVYKKTKD